MTNQWQRVREWAAQLAQVTPIAVGLPGDGLVGRSSGSRLDKPWHELAQEFDDAVDAWRKHPLARRLVGLTTAYTVGSGITLSSDRPEVQRFLREFWSANRMALRVDEWSDELARSGELFPVLFTHPVSGLSSVRTVPAALIERVEVDPEDYEQERRYWQTTGPGEAAKWWAGVGHREPPGRAADAGLPLMLHYAVNRPVGAVRGESDLAPILPWLRRYSRWLEDRVRLNAAMRAFLWIVHAPARLRTTLEERYRQPPEAGSVIIAESGVETWDAVTPNLHAGDAEKDGRAIRWMIAAGGPGTALLDLGEGEDSNLATGQAMAEQRRRFLRRRQAYLAWLLSDLVVQAYTRYLAATNPVDGGGPLRHADLMVQTAGHQPGGQPGVGDRGGTAGDGVAVVGRNHGTRRRLPAHGVACLYQVLGRTAGRRRVRPYLAGGTA